jgi:translation initiation factor 2B subunit (eIF-2B alpha/beta/delta family)
MILCYFYTQLPELLPADDILPSNFHPNVTIINPSFDYVPPELVTLFIFNTYDVDWSFSFLF